MFVLHESSSVCPFSKLSVSVDVSTCYWWFEWRPLVQPHLRYSVFLFSLTLSLCRTISPNIHFLSVR